MMQDKLEINIQKIKEEIPEYFREFLYYSKNNMPGYRNFSIQSMLLITDIGYDTSVYGEFHPRFYCEIYDIKTNTCYKIYRRPIHILDCFVSNEIDFIKSTFRFWDKRGTKYQRNLGTKYEEIKKLKQEKKDKENA